MRPLLLYVTGLLAVTSLAGQGGPPAPAATQAPPAAPPAVASGPAISRAAWFSDKRPLRIGDIVTIVVDEAVNAREKQGVTAQAKRSQSMGLNVNVSPTLKVGPQKSFESGVDNSSHNTGEANRMGDLTAVISVRVVSIEPTGVAKLKGQKTVSVDGRNQVIELEGLVRPEDVSADNTVASSRIAESIISYKGKKIGPAKGILGSILSIFWP
jgi:flagellar L-ring protein precursor FlgH